MKASDLVAPVIEPVEERYDRDWLRLKDDRKVRGFDYKSEERRDREYVDPDAVNVTAVSGDPAAHTGQVETTVSVDGTVTDRFDNAPEGFDAVAYEDDLVYNPNDASVAPEPDPAP